jgi:hypothetical protein
VVSWARAGELAADATVQILRGKAPADVVVKSPGPGVYLFDWRQLKRWGFSESDLPPGSIVEYRTPTAWEQYRWRIVGAIAIIAAQFLLIVALLIHRRKRRQAEGSLREVAGRLLQSQDEERRRIVRDLHDGTAQHLSGMALTIGQVLADFPPRPRPLARTPAGFSCREPLNEVRTVSYVLHPPILDGLGLVPALRWYRKTITFGAGAARMPEDMIRSSFNHSYTIEAKFDPAKDKTTEGVIIAAGGGPAGLSLYIKEGKADIYL